MPTPDWLIPILNPLAVIIGGGFGAWVRFAIGRSFSRFEVVKDFPWHTFGINVLGSFILGLVAVWCKDRPTWYLLLGTGVCGGFTTFSTFSLETLTLIEKDRLGLAAAYVTGSVAAGLLGIMLAIKMARAVTLP